MRRCRLPLLHNQFVAKPGSENNLSQQNYASWFECRWSVNATNDVSHVIGQHLYLYQWLQFTTQWLILKICLLLYHWDYGKINVDHDLVIRINRTGPCWEDCHAKYNYIIRRASAVIKGTTEVKINVITQVNTGQNKWHNTGQYWSLSVYLFMAMI